jgi:DNA-binding transcriptional LysR family regulator
MLMNMVLARDLEIRHLIALVGVAEERTFGRAAQRLGYTQSAISQQIAALERAVGAPLFDRPGGPRPVELTPLGRLLADHAREVLARVETAAKEVRRFQAGVIGRLDVGTFQSVSTTMLPAILGRLRTERPQLDAHLIESDVHEDLVRRVVEGELDVSFLLNREAPGLETIPLLTDPFVVVALPDEVDHDAVSVTTLIGQPLIGQHDNTCQRFVDDGLRSVGIEPDYVFRSSDNTAVAAMVRAGMGMAVLPLLAVDTSDPRLAIRPLDPPIPPRHIGIGWRRGRTLSPAAERFVELAQEQAAELRGRDLAQLAAV